MNQPPVENVRQGCLSGDASSKICEEHTSTTENKNMPEDKILHASNSSNPEPTILTIEEDLTSQSQKYATDLSVITLVQDVESAHSAVPSVPSILGKEIIKAAMETVVADPPAPPYNPYDYQTRGYRQDYTPMHSREETLRRLNVEEDLLGGYNTEEQNVFDDIEERRIFVRKVYIILSVQFGFVFLFLLLSSFEKNTKFWIARNSLLVIILAALMTLLLLILVIFKQLRRVFILNYIIIVIFTFGCTIIVVYISVRFRPWIVMTTVGVTGVCCSLISVLTFYTKFDISSWRHLLFILLVATIIMGLFGFFFFAYTDATFLYIVFTALVCLLMLLYIMLETQQIIGRHKIELSAEEEAAAVITIYVDTMAFLVYMLQFIKCTCDAN